MLNKKTSSRGYERVLFLIEWLAKQVEPVSLSEVVSYFGWPKSTTHLLLQSLVEFGYLKQNEYQRYRLVRLPGESTPDTIRWGALIGQSESFLQEAMQETGETVCLAVLTEDLMVKYINRILPEREIRYERDITKLRIPHLVASGLVLLSEMDASQLMRYREVHQISQSEYTALLSKLTEVKTRQYYMNREGTVEGAAGVASVIRARNEAVLGAINITGPKDRVLQQEQFIIDVAVRTARNISARLGYQKV